MKHTQLLTLALATLISTTTLTLSPAFAQQGPPQGGPGFGGPGMGGPGGPGMRGQRPGMGMGNPQVVIRMKSVQRHLRLTADQVAAVDALRPPRGPGMGGPGGPGMGGPGMGGPGGPGMGGPGMGGPGMPDPLAEILTPEQNTRLRQLSLQFDAPMSMRRPDVVERLVLSDDQLGAIEEIIQRLMPRPQPGERPDPSTRPDWATMQANKARAQQQAFALLTANQKRTWAALTGPVFTDWEQPIMPGGQGGRGIGPAQGGGRQGGGRQGGGRGPQ